MFITAQHVVSPVSKLEGINTFLFVHDGQAWEHVSVPDIPDQNPGVLRAQSISVMPPGNRVRSYLDIVAPDEVRWDDVRVGLAEFVGRCSSGPLPWAGESRNGYLRIGMERALSSAWQRELAILYRAAQVLWMAHGR